MNLSAVIEEILATAMKVTVERERLAVAFKISGINLNADMRVTGINGDPSVALEKLMQNLSELAVVKISAKQVIRRAGLNL